VPRVSDTSRRAPILPPPRSRPHRHTLLRNYALKSASLRVFAWNEGRNRRFALIRMLLHCVNLGADGKMCGVGPHRKRCAPQHQALTRAARSTTYTRVPCNSLIPLDVLQNVPRAFSCVTQHFPRTLKHLRAKCPPNTWALGVSHHTHGTRATRGAHSRRIQQPLSGFSGRDWRAIHRRDRGRLSGVNDRDSAAHRGHLSQPRCVFSKDSPASLVVSHIGQVRYRTPTRQRHPPDAVMSLFRDSPA
jgi:hypothetical protein